MSVECSVWREAPHPTLDVHLLSQFVGLRMICSLLSERPFVLDSVETPRTLRSRALHAGNAPMRSWADRAASKRPMLLGKDVEHALPRVHFDAVVGCEPKRVVEQDLGCPHVNLDRRRIALAP